MHFHFLHEERKQDVTIVTMQSGWWHGNVKTCDGQKSGRPLGTAPDAGALCQSHERNTLIVGDNNFGFGASNVWHAPLQITL